MTDTEKLTLVKTYLQVADDSKDALLTAFLLGAGLEINNYKYGLMSSIPYAVDAEDDMTQVMAVVAGYGLMGAENQSVSVENGIHRHFHYTDMVDYVRNHVTPYAGVL